MDKIKKSRNLRKAIYIIGIIIFIALIIYLAYEGRQYFSRHEIRLIRISVTSFGSWTPLAIFGLIFINTMIPPLPIPAPLIEVVAGVTLGFWEGFFVVWISQIITSCSAFIVTRLIGRKFFNKFIENKLFTSYRNFVKEKGSKAVLITRLTMSAPFNFVSFFAGVTSMSFAGFSLATILGTVPESIIYTFIGSILRRTHLSLFYVLILTVATAIVGPTITFFAFRKRGKQISKIL